MREHRGIEKSCAALGLSSAPIEAAPPASPPAVPAERRGNPSPAHCRPPTAPRWAGARKGIAKQKALPWLTGSGSALGGAFPRPSSGSGAASRPWGLLGGCGSAVRSRCPRALRGCRSPPPHGPPGAGGRAAPSPRPRLCWEKKKKKERKRKKEKKMCERGGGEGGRWRRDAAAPAVGPRGAVPQPREELALCRPEERGETAQDAAPPPRPAPPRTVRPRSALRRRPAESPHTERLRGQSTSRPGLRGAARGEMHDRARVFVHAGTDEPRWIFPF